MKGPAAKITPQEKVCVLLARRPSGCQKGALREAQEWANVPREEVHKGSSSFIIRWLPCTTLIQ